MSDELPELVRGFQGMVDATQAIRNLLQVQGNQLVLIDERLTRIEAHISDYGPARRNRGPPRDIAPYCQHCRGAVAPVD